MSIEIIIPYLYSVGKIWKLSIIYKEYKYIKTENKFLKNQEDYITEENT